jgi:hypothetical protein
VELLRKLADKLNITAGQISALHRIGPSGIAVTIDNETVQTFVSDMTFQLQVIRGRFPLPVLSNASQFVGMGHDFCF